MWLIRRVRFTMGTIMMFVLTSAAASALFVKVLAHTELAPLGWKLDVPSLFLLAIVLTAVALGAWKEHSAVQTMVQITLACVGCLALIWICEFHLERAIRYWFEVAFAAMVSLPLLARRYVKNELPKGPRRDWWKKTCEAIFFSFLNILLVTAGGLLQATIYVLASQFLVKTAP